MVQTKNVPVFVGGKTAIDFRDAIVNAGAIPLETDISLAIYRMDEELNTEH